MPLHQIKIMDEKFDKNKSPVGWYVATELLRHIPDGVDPEDLTKRFLVWENLILIQAEDAETAYQKAMDEGSLNDTKSVSGKWQFEGLTSLLAVYEDFADGSEIMWIEHKQKSLSVVKRMVKAKERLEVFVKD